MFLIVDYLFFFLENLEKMFCVVVIFDLLFGDYYFFVFIEVLNIFLLIFKVILWDLLYEFVYFGFFFFDMYVCVIVDVIEFFIDLDRILKE